MWDGEATGGGRQGWAAATGEVGGLKKTCIYNMCNIIYIYQTKIKDPKFQTVLEMGHRTEKRARHLGQLITKK